MTIFHDSKGPRRYRRGISGPDSKRHLSRPGRRLAGVLAALAALAVVAACSSGAGSSGSGLANSSTPLVNVTAIQGSPLVNYAPIYVAQQAGYFKKEGINLSLTTASSSSAAVQALVGGSADIGFAVTSDLLTAYKQNVPIRGVFALTDRWGFELTVSDKFAQAHGITASTPAATIANALKGTVIGVSSTASSSSLSLSYFLQQAGVPSSDVRYVALGSNASAFVAALKQGRISSFWISPPAGQLAESTNVGKIVFNADDGQMPALTSPFQVMIASTSYIAANKSTLAKLRSAIAMGLTLIKQNPSEAESMVAKTFPTLAPSIVSAGFHAVLPSFAAGPAIDSQRLALVLQLMPSADQSIDVAKAISAS